MPDKHEYQRSGKSVTSIALENFNEVMDQQSEDLYLFPDFAKRCGRTPILRTNRYEEFEGEYEISTDYFYLYDPKIQIQELEIASDDMSVIADETFLTLPQEAQDAITKTAKELTELMFTEPQHYFHEVGSKKETPGDIIKKFLQGTLKGIGRREWLEAQAAASDVFNSAATMWAKLYGTLIVPESTANFRQMLVTISEVFKDIKIKTTKTMNNPRQLRYKKKRMKPSLKTSDLKP